MAVDKSRIQERLKALFPGVNLSKQRIEQLSTRLSLKPQDDAEDAEIDEVINAANDFMPFADIAKEDDRVRTLEAKAKGSNPDPTPPTPPADPAPNPSPQDQMPAWFKPFADKVNNLEQQQQGMTLAQKREAFVKAAQEKKIPEAWIKRVTVTDDFNQEEALSELETDYTEFARQNKLAAFGNDTPPAGKGAPAGNKPATKAELDAVGL